ncbi:MAG: polysaccharide deacetylase family protein [bacterium]
MKKSKKTPFFLILFVTFILIWIIAYDFYFRYDVNKKISSFVRFNSSVHYKRTIFLTYDDGPSNDGKVYGDTQVNNIFLKNAITDIIPDYNFHITPTENLLNILKASNITALFFISGISFDASENGTHQIQRIINENHKIGNHFYSHKKSTAESIEWILEDMTKAHNLIKQLTHIPINIYRPPYGDWNLKLSKKVWKNEVLKDYIFPMMWTNDFNDWHPFDNPQLARQIQRQVTEFLKNNINKSGRIVLLHDPYIYSVLVTAELIRQAPQYGFTIEDIETLIKAWKENINYYIKSPYLYYISDRLGQLKENITFIIN